MRISLPPITGNPLFVEGVQSLVLIGANGSGKTRMSIWIERNNSSIHTHRISAQKSLDFPPSITPSNLDDAEKRMMYGTTGGDLSWLRIHGKQMQRWSNRPETAMLNDYQLLMEFLFTEHYQAALEFRKNRLDGQNDFQNKSKLETAKDIWEKVLPHRKLEIRTGKMEVTAVETCYNASDMSDGEREIFHFIGEALSAPPDSIILVDEPENHLHQSIIIRLWDYIEQSRSDCLFLYITHSIDFAVSRTNSQLIWVKSYNSGDQWDYKLIRDISEPLLLDLLGSRENVLFVEGDSNSIDYKLYSSLYEEITVVPLSGCENVVHATRAFNSLHGLHYLRAIGIIDRDCKSQEMIDDYKSENIFATPTAEVENLFLLPDIIREVLIYTLRSETEQTDGVQTIQKGILDTLRKNRERQAVIYTQCWAANALAAFVNRKVDSIDEFEGRIRATSSITVKEHYEAVLSNIDQIISNNDIIEALRFLNHKGLIQECGLTACLHMSKDTYIDTVIRLIRQEKESGIKIKQAIREKLGINWGESNPVT